MSTPVSTDPREWFGKDELATCPFCGETAVPRQADEDVSVCLECKAVWRLENGQPKRIGLAFAEKKSTATGATSRGPPAALQQGLR
jgi:hypothetical protein